MDPRQLAPKGPAVLAELLGYLNFSSGASDARFQGNLNCLQSELETQPTGSPAWQALPTLLLTELGRLAGVNETFRSTEQAEAVIRLTFERVLPGYRQFHQDLLYHQSDDALFRPFFLARACEAVLAQGSPWDETERIVSGAVGHLNDFIGHRPVAVLRTAQKIEPYSHEWVRPIPLYLRGAGAGAGPYRDIVEQAVQILRQTDPELLEQAWFDPELMDELALDPRAYDFDHPVNRRPNYQFGQWDPHHLDNKGRYRRFVVQEVALDALAQRVRFPGDIAAEEALFEAAAALAGIILMASGISGSGPDTHDSATTLASLMPRIASYRDAFYHQLLQSVSGPHGTRLRAEAAELHQPFGGARQHLNGRLARLRASQLQHVHLAQLFASMGYPEASTRQAHVVPVASARMLCEINGRLTAGHHCIDRGQLARAGELLPEIDDLLHRAIECGALVDPWNILGFQGQFSLFAALENSVHDHRVDVLIRLMEQIFGLYARLQGEAAAHGEGPLAEVLSARLATLARWWDQFATLDVANVEHVSGREAAESATHVAQALGAWRQAGAAAGDVAFWRRHVDRFNSAKAYALVVDALLEKRDFVASMSLLIQWLSRAEQTPLVEGDYSFHEMAVRWLNGVQAGAAGAGGAGPEKAWALIAKFFDYLEANAEHYWEAPHFDFSPPGGGSPLLDDQRDAEEQNEEDLFGAAYDEVTYRDSTGDGHEADMLEGGAPASDFELDFESRRLGARLAFLGTLARLWKIAASASTVVPGDCDDALRGWFSRAVENRRGLFDLLQSVHRFRLPSPSPSHESLVEYDRRRMVKESILARAVVACVETSDAARVLAAAGRALDGGRDLADWEQQAVVVLRGMFRRDVEEMRRLFPQLRLALEAEPILYVPLSKKGAPGQIVGAQTIQQVLLALLRGLPKLGLLSEACQVIAAAQAMEQHRPNQEGAVTEFDRLFEVGYRALVETLVLAAQGDVCPSSGATAPATPDAELIDCLQVLTESLLKRWLVHSRSLRLSVLEKVGDAARWQALTDFIERYGHDLFTQRFLNLGNLRAILHQGVENWLKDLEANDDSDLALCAALSGGLPRAKAAELLGLAIEAVVENYAEFKDFNSTTTQSDKGELLYILLDFLRLKTSYERLAWNIKPVVLAHDVLVRLGRLDAAELWRRAVADRTSQAADWHLKRLAELTRQYGVRLPTVADRLGERFIRPLLVDRVRSLVRPAVDQARRGQPPHAFMALEQELSEFTENPSGSGLDVPDWLVMLEEEVGAATAVHGRWERDADGPATPQFRLSWEDLQNQVKTELS